MRFHVLGLPHTQVTKAYSHCAYTQKIRLFCNMMKGLGHTVYLYASTDNDANTDNTFTCISKEEQLTLIGIEEPQDNLKIKFDPELYYWDLFNKRAINYLTAMIQPEDFIITFAGLCQKPIADAFPNNMTVEAGIGYSGVFSDYRVFESYAWMHTMYGSLYGADTANGKHYDCVIPNYYDTNDFPAYDGPREGFLYIGRLIDRKGYQIAVDVATRLNKTLYVAGQGTPPKGDNIIYLGVLGPEAKSKAMSSVEAVFVPTQYIEPFGGVAVEAMLCGTPIITTDFGAFTETNIHNGSGFRCRTFGEFIYAAQNVHKLNKLDIRFNAIQKYSIDHVRYMYQAYFEQLLTLREKGWYSEWEGISKYDRYTNYLERL